MLQKDLECSATQRRLTRVTWSQTECWVERRWNTIAECCRANGCCSFTSQGPLYSALFGRVVLAVATTSRGEAAWREPPPSWLRQPGPNGCSVQRTHRSRRGCFRAMIVLVRFGMRKPFADLDLKHRRGPGEQLARDRPDVIRPEDAVRAGQRNAGCSLQMARSRTGDSQPIRVMKIQPLCRVERHAQGRRVVYGSGHRSDVAERSCPRRRVRPP